MGVETNRQFHYFHEIVDRIKMLYTLHPPLISPKRAIKDSARQCCSAASQGGRHWNASNSVTNDCALCSRYKKVHASQRTVLKHKVVFEWLYLPLVLSLSHTHIPTPESDRASKSNYQFLGSLTPRGRCQQNPNIRNSTGQLTQVHQKIFPRAKARQKWGITYRLKET